jgi:hypothetical protein
VSGEFRNAPAIHGAVLVITCENETKARLLAAKYISDLNCIPGVNIIALPQPGRPAFEIQGNGIIAVMRSAAVVTILSAPKLAGLAALSSLVPKSVTWLSKGEVEVPMYLDRWDKFCFRHYYLPLQSPKGQVPESYDFIADLDWAKANSRAGILTPVSLLANDTAEGMMSRGETSWMDQELASRGLPTEAHLLGPPDSLPAWFGNKYRDQLQVKMPGFTGNFRTLMSPQNGGQGVISWHSPTAMDASLAYLQSEVSRYAKMPNVTSYLEPHNELKHGWRIMFFEYGPLADIAYRKYLGEKYRELAQVSDRWKVPLKTWDDVRVPEIASFAGWNSDSVDVGGTWKVGYEELNDPLDKGFKYEQGSTPASKPAPDEWYAAEFDDSAWPSLPGAGNDRQMLVAKRPAVFRRRFNIPEDWLARQKRLWLYEWDLNMATGQQVRVAVNGKIAGSSLVQSNVPHWFAVEVTGLIHSGANSVAIRVPQGYMAYKTYLSATPPARYPYLGEGMNARWVDFVGLTQWGSVRGVRSGMEMIRQVAHDPQILLMAPMGYADGILSNALDFGGEFHDTGAMGAFWDNYPASVSRGADLPVSVEPGGPADDLTGWKRQWGRWQTEGVNAVDYFITIGSVLYNPEIKADYEAHRKQISFMGQSHHPKAKIASLYSNEVDELIDYPWGGSPGSWLKTGYWNWNAVTVLRGEYAYDGLTPLALANGGADKYALIVDSNTSIMSEGMVSNIERYVRNGGVFVTVAQTGRGTPERPDAWPISRLTGYDVTHIDSLNADGGVGEKGELLPAPGQKVYGAELNGVAANGLHLSRRAPDAHDLLMWKDGTVAAGMRQIGNGYIVQLGAKFTGAKIADRVEPGANDDAARHLRALLTAIVRWRGIAPEEARLAVENEQVWMTHRVSNNGLYDAWVVYNWSQNQSQTVSAALSPTLSPSYAFDIRDGSRVAVSITGNETRLDGITLTPLETRVILTPRGRADDAPAKWFELQRNWWRGTVAPPALKLPDTSPRFALDLTPEWKFKPLDAQEDALPLTTVGYTDKAWGTRDLGLWNTLKTGGKTRAVFRKTFTVPAAWTNGRVSVWLTSWHSGSGRTWMKEGRVVLDGAEVKPMNNKPYIVSGLDALRAGTTHTIAVEINGAGALAGSVGQCWLSFEPTPSVKVDLAGKWEPSVDALVYGKPVTLPGQFNALTLRRMVAVDAKLAGKNAVVTVDGSPELVAVLVNGHLVRRQHTMIGERWSLNVTPFVKFGDDNEIEIVRWNGAGRALVREASLGFYDAGSYP